MGRGSGSNVEVRPNSIRLEFVPVPGGPRVRRTLMIAGKVAAPTPPNIKYAHRIAAEIRERIRLGTFSIVEYFPVSGLAGDAATVSGRLDIWFDAQRVEHSTRAGYSSAVKFWKACFGDKHVRALVRSDVLMALANRPELKGKTIKNYTSVLHQALELAVADKATDTNPAAKLPRPKIQKELPDPFTSQEVELIVAYAREHYPPEIANLIEWWMFTGVRTSEMAGLKWSSVNLREGHMEISEALVRGKAKATTKTDTARRVVLNSRALAALQRQRKHTQVAGDHVWLDPRYGTPWTEERAFRRSYWTPMLKVLGIHYRRPYNMRHTFATMMLMAGRTPGWCAQQLGHSVEIFLRTYTRWLQGAQDDRELAGFEAWLKRQTQ